MSTIGPQSSSSSAAAAEDDEIDPFAVLLPQESASHLPSVELPAPNSAVDPHLRRYHARSLNADIVIRQLVSQGLSFQLWPAASTLFSLLDNHALNPSDSRLLSSIRRHGRRTRILEPGSGTGLVGIAAAAILGAEVTVTDLAHVVDNLDFNVTANSTVITAGGGEVRVSEMSWGNVDQMEKIGREYDLILGSDVVYHDHLYDPLLETLKYFLIGGERKEENEEEMVFVMAHLKRWKKESSFFKKAKKWFDVEVIHQDCPSDGKRVGVTVYRFTGKRARGLGSGLSSGLGSTPSPSPSPSPSPTVGSPKMVGEGLPL